MDAACVEHLRREREEARRSGASFKPVARAIMGADPFGAYVVAIQDAFRSTALTFEEAVARSVPPGVDAEVWRVACVAYVWSHRVPRFLGVRRGEFVAEADRLVPILLRRHESPDPVHAPSGGTSVGIVSP